MATGGFGAFGQQATLLRFIGSRTALTASLGFSSTADLGAFNDRRFNSVAGAVGLRRYLRQGLGLRPIVGGSIVVSSWTGRATAVGGSIDAGAAWFFTPHLSLGVMGSANVQFRERAWYASATLARLTAAVYF